jgi:dihydroflavonol-4-reductase
MPFYIKGIGTEVVGIPLSVAHALAFGGNVAATVFRRDVRLSTLMVRLMHIMSPMDHGKARRELGWQPAPIHDAIRKAVEFYRERANDAARQEFSGE